MKSLLSMRTSSVVLAVAPLLLVTACAAKANVAPAALAPRAAAQPPAALLSRSNPAPTTGTIAISDEIRKACGIADEDAYFAFDSSWLLTTDVRPLDAVAKCFSVGPLAGHGLKLVGHADPRGETDYNMTLGQSRADSVEHYLDQRGVSQSKVGTTSRGAMDATGQDEAGWARDRRVDVMLGS